MKRSDRKGSLLVPIVCFLVLIMAGLSVAEKGLSELLGAGGPHLFWVSFSGDGFASITLLGQITRVSTTVIVAEFNATPEAVTLGASGRDVRIPLQIVIPHSDKALAQARLLVTEATTVGFSASRVIYQWWESRLENR